MNLSPALSLLLVCSLPASLTADWLSFRGDNTGGVADGPAPVSCDENTIAWQISTPGRGVSTPIIVGQQIIITSSSGVNDDRLHVVSYDVANGQQRWHRQFWATGRTICHPTSANAAPTPTSDGEHIVAFYSSNDVVCLGLDGSLKWFRGLGHDYPRAGNDVGMASSPLLAEGVVVCQVENQGDSFVEALDVTSGKSLWRLERPRSANWTSPVYLPADDQGLVLLKNSRNVSAHRLRTGEQVWRYEGNTGGIPNMVVTDNRIYVPGSTFLVLDHSSVIPSLIWDSNRIKPSPSPIVSDDRLYFINSAGVLTCANAINGDQIWKVRVGGKYWASPILAGNHIYAVNDGGQLTVVDRDGNKVAQHTFDDSVLGSPTASDGALYVRGESKLWKVANQ